MIVIDASICAPWFLSDEQSEASDKAASQVTDGGAVAPQLWQFEIRNLLVMALRRRRINADKLEFAIARVVRLDVEIDEAANWPNIVALAVSQRLTVYDAAYLELAAHRALTLATLDRRLAEAARTVGVPLLG